MSFFPNILGCWRPKFSFRNWVEFGTILEGLRNLGGWGRFDPPPLGTPLPVEVSVACGLINPVFWWVLVGLIFCGRNVCSWALQPRNVVIPGVPSGGGSASWNFVQGGRVGAQSRQPCVDGWWALLKVQGSVLSRIPSYVILLLSSDKCRDIYKGHRSPFLPSPYPVTSGLSVVRITRGLNSGRR